MMLPPTPVGGNSQAAAPIQGALNLTGLFFKDQCEELNGGITMKFRKMTSGQRLGWYFASTVYGLCVLAIGIQSGFLFDENIFVEAALVFILFWLVGVIGLRLYVQDVDPTSFRSIMGLKK